jgi:ribosomal protein S18 acetylase RimI-like enzyme
MKHRLASPDDFGKVYDLHMEEEANPYLTYDPMPREAFKKIYDSVLLTNTLYLVEGDSDIIATYRLIPKTDRQAHTLYLGGFTISREFRGMGWGIKVLEEIKSMAVADRKKRIELTVDVHNTSAIGLYEKAGFRVEGTLAKSYRLSSTNQYYDEYLMAVIL